MDDNRLDPLSWTGRLSTAISSPGHSRC